MDRRHEPARSHDDPSVSDASAAQAADALRARLIAGEAGWQYGERIPAEATLVRELGLGRSTISAALQRLTAEGWLEHGEGARPVVSRKVGPIPGPLTATRRAEVLDVIEARRALECEAARLAALRRSGVDLVAMTDALLRRRAANAEGNTRGAVSADADFHAAVVRAANSPCIAKLFGTMDEEITSMLLDLHAHDLVGASSTRAHEDLATAIEIQDPDMAALATRRQFAAAEQHLRLGGQ